MSWQLFRRSEAGSFQIVGVDDQLLIDAPLPTLPVAVEVTIRAPSVLPEDLVATEAELERLVSERRGRIAGTVRGATTLSVLAYLPSGDDVDAFRSVPLPSGGGVDVDVRADPAWANFDAVRPVGLEEQSLEDLRLLDELFSAGDAGGVRPVDHVVVDVESERTDGLVASLSAVGYLVERSASQDGVVMVHHEVDPVEITPDSWTIRQIAERFGATYAGWASAVIRNDPPPPRPRRRPFRRRP